ncbi:MAG: hypothetical protein Q4B63_00085 [Clostridium perfringens]|nr:hypothetical protein [Clostridium perfringens]
MELIICVLSVILFIVILFMEYHRKFNITRIRRSIIEAGNYLCIFLSLVLSYTAMTHIKEFGQVISLCLVSLIDLVNDYTYFPTIFAMIVFFLIAIVIYIILRIILALLVKLILNPILRRINNSQVNKPEKSKRLTGVFLSLPRAAFYMCLIFLILNITVKNF